MDLHVFTSETAEKTLEAHLNRTSNPTKYIAGFENRFGKQVAIERSRKNGVYCWLEVFDRSLLSTDIEIVNRSNPGQPYSKGQSRNSNLNLKNASRLTDKHEVWYVKFGSVSALKAYLSWLEK
ncbi:hypothetical protein Q4508_05450 [Amphritea sp. 2_MG-2023]|uniref:hypothetical protein n=1 Tax=Amphritea TaxID=515417 RepID=UPI001C0696D2|nr:MULTISPECIES: hypothetical protein [Amphritea]MBU2965908.1 hypothetical protein [Amphritea atlantica]MDO6417999.1 hypothetical protein [Amphritea sp. 2_MG-2023]